MSEWISVKDRLPEKNGYYLIWYSLSEMHGIGYYLKTDGWDAYDANEVTHWMPLPELPKKESEVESDA